MNSLDPDALDGIWSPTPHPPPAKEAVPGVVSVRLFGEDEDEITDEVQVVEHGAGYHAAQAQAVAPPPLTLILPDPPPPLAGTPHRSRSLFNGILAGVLLGGVLLWWAGDEPEEIPVTDQVVVEVIEPTVAEIEIEPAVAEIEIEPAVAEIEIERAVAEIEIESAVAEIEIEPAVAEIEIERAVAEIEIEPAVAEIEIEPAEPEPVEIEIEPKTTEFVPPPKPRRNTAFPGTFAPNSHVATIQNVEAWATLVKALKSSTGPISLVGHTDLEGKHPTDRDNAWLQADSVRALLVTQGLDRDRIAVLGAGTRQPLGSNATAEGRSQNRRVQVLYTRRQTD